MSDTILKIKGLNKILGKKQILHSIDMECYSGEVYGFLGPNGAGKTTTIKIAVGLLQLDEGEISINGKDIRKDFEGAMANVGGIVENPEMYKYLSGMENLRQYARMREGVTEERIKEVVELVRLSNRINDKVSKYSLGMRQRIHNVHRLNGHTAFGSVWTGLGKIPCVRKHRPCFYLKGLLNICSAQPDLCRGRSYSTHGGVPTHRMGRLYKAFCIKQNKNIKRAEQFRSFFVAEKGKQMNRLSYKHKIDKGE